jgi:hypothetical protein
MFFILALNFCFYYTLNFGLFKDEMWKVTVASGPKYEYNRERVG